MDEIKISSVDRNGRIPGDAGTMYTLNGVPHREDGPAVIYKDGTIHYFKNGKKHRTDGPATIYSQKVRSLGIRRELWAIDGKIYSFREFIKLTSIPEEDKIALILKYGTGN